MLIDLRRQCCAYDSLMQAYSRGAVVAHRLHPQCSACTHALTMLRDKPRLLQALAKQHVHGCAVREMLQESKNSRRKNLGVPKFTSPCMEQIGNAALHASASSNRIGRTGCSKMTSKQDHNTLQHILVGAEICIHTQRALIYHQ